MASAPKILVIDESTPERDLFLPTHGTGLDLSGRPEGFAYAGTAEPFPDSMLIPRSQWQAMIAEMEARESGLDHLCDRAGLPCKDQARTNYCWGNAPAYCMEVLQVKQNQEITILSPASICGPISGYRNVGGWGKTALQYISDHGIAPASLWPANAIEPRYNTPEAKAAAALNKATEWWELEPGNLDQVISCLLHRIPVSAGLSWWGHQVSYIRPVWVDGAIGVKFRNSWGMRYGTNGYGVLQGRRILPDDATAPRVAVAN